jgi:hypothetical protein
MQSIAERLWMSASTIANEAARAGMEGREFAVVADESRKAAGALHTQVENCLFEQGEPENEGILEMATHLNFLALNAAIAAAHGKERGKGVAVCADDIRNLAGQLSALLGAAPWRMAAPIAAEPMTTLDERFYYLQAMVGDFRFMENLAFVREVVSKQAGREGDFLILRGIRIPVINLYPLLEKKRDEAAYLILKTPWAKEDNAYAVAVDGQMCLGVSPVGTPSRRDESQPLAAYLRDTWESSDGEPFRFMDWVKLAGG